MNGRFFFAALLVAGCSAGGSTHPTEQIEFDLTVDADRAQFREEGLTFRGAVGPFAVYQVTSASPRLVGPDLAPAQHVGYAMLCGATKYFAPTSGATAFIKLHGGEDGNLPLVSTDQEPAHDGECAPPKDTFGNPLPDGGSGSDDMGPETPPVFTPPGDHPDLSLVFDPPVIQSLQIKFDPAPDVGSTVLVRRVALTGQRQHNDSHVIPSICCSGGSCALAPLQ